MQRSRQPLTIEVTNDRALTASEIADWKIAARIAPGPEGNS